jgi:hypothetical protein
MLFIDYSLAFNTIVPSKFIIELKVLDLNPALCNWVLDFDRPPGGEGRKQHLHFADPQHWGSTSSPFLYSLFTHDCVAMHASNSIIKFSEDTTVAGLITNNDETA